MKKFSTYIKTMCMALLAMSVFTACQEEDDYIAQQLSNGYWQGYLGVYYSNRWNVQGSTYATEMCFYQRSAYYTSGRGYEVDYDTRSPFRDYAYCTFKWFIVDGEITLIYDDDLWAPIYITDYRLYPTRFTGYIYDGTTRNIQFDFNNVATSEWDGYRSGRYGDFSSYYYYAPTRASQSEATDSVPFIDRTSFCTAQDGEQGHSYLSGAFAKRVAR